MVHKSVTALHMASPKKYFTCFSSIIVFVKLIPVDEIRDIESTGDEKRND